MSVFRKILDKLGLRREQSDVIGTAKVAHNDPPTAPSDRKSAHATLRSRAAPTSDIDFKDNGGAIGKEAKK